MAGKCRSKLELTEQRIGVNKEKQPDTSNSSEFIVNKTRASLLLKMLPASIAFVNDSDIVAY